MTPAAFWHLTPHECKIYCEQRVDAELAAYRRALWAAWHVAAFSRQKRLPNLARIMRKLDQRGPERQSPKKILMMVEMINSAFGGKDLRKQHG